MKITVTPVKTSSALPVVKLSDAHMGKVVRKVSNDAVCVVSYGGDIPRLIDVNDPRRTWASEVIAPDVVVIADSLKDYFAGIDVPAPESKTRFKIEMDLSRDEADVFLSLTGKIAGGHDGPRRITDQVYNALAAHLPTPGKYLFESRASKTGYMYAQSAPVSEE